MRPRICQAYYLFSAPQQLQQKHFNSTSAALKHTIHICELTQDQILEQSSIIPYVSMKPTSGDSFVVINYTHEQTNTPKMQLHYCEM